MVINTRGRGSNAPIWDDGIGEAKRPRRHSSQENDDSREKRPDLKGLHKRL
jgi:hypothetical protein